MQPTHIHDLPAAAARRIARRLEACSEMQPDGCIAWRGQRDRYGYGYVVVSLGGRKRHLGAHRASWIVAHGRIPVGLVIDHLCRNRACVNPEHLEPVSGAENTRRSGIVGRATGEAQRNKTACVNGHAFTPDNTHVYVTRGGYTARICIACRRQRSREYKARRRLA